MTSRILTAAITICLLTSYADARELSKCSWVFHKESTPNDLRSGEFVEETKENAQWLADASKAEPGYVNDSNSCRPLDNKSREWTLFVCTENGTISLQYSLTEYECENVLFTLVHSHDGESNWMSQGGDYKTGECFK